MAVHHDVLLLKGVSPDFTGAESLSRHLEVVRIVELNHDGLRLPLRINQVIPHICAVGQENFEKTSFALLETFKGYTQSGGLASLKRVLENVAHEVEVRPEGEKDPLLKNLLLLGGILAPAIHLKNEEVLNFAALYEFKVFQLFSNVKDDHLIVQFSKRRILVVFQPHSEQV